MIADFIKRNSLTSLIFLFSLILLNGVGVTLPIPNLQIIGKQFDFPLIGIVEAVFIVFSMIALVVWGYFVDKYDRRPLLLLANFIWLIPAGIIFLIPDSLIVYFIGRLIMAIGLAAFSPLSYSIIADFAQYEDRGIISAGLNLAWVGSSAVGIILGAFFTANWYYSFGVLAFMGLILFCWQFFVKIPIRGVKEPAFAEIANFQYPWRINYRLLPQAFQIRSLFWLLAQGIFALIPGTVFTYWLVSFLASSEGMAVTIGEASIISITVASGRAPGYLVFGKLGDNLASKSSNSAIRAKIAGLGMVSQSLFFFGAFFALASSSHNIVLFAILFWIGSFVGAASGPNRTSLLFNISLPEFRGTLGALYSLTDHLGAALGVFVSTFFLQYLNYYSVFNLSLLFYLLASACWFGSIKHISADESEINDTLLIRAEEITLKD
ncbi:MAG: MFS transporter [Candidatus Hodarchaeales archaeon]|jgi:MFS family permease